MVDREKIAQLMKERGLRVTDLARRSGLHTGHICDILSGRRRKLQAATMYRLARALEVSVEDLLDTRAREESDAVASH
mgnify:CR=1 FL=1